MNQILTCNITDNQAALWFLGQAGYVIRSGNVTLAIDPYLSDSVGRIAPDFARVLPVPLEPEEMDVDIFVVTHDHLDHLDPGTIERYRHKDSTIFVAPRFAARKLLDLGVPEANIRKIDADESIDINGTLITGVFALPTGADVLDTTGYHVAFSNGRNFYHASDTGYCSLLIDAAPHSEVLLVPINGKWGNLNIDQAIELTEAVDPQFVLPNHYDLMALNAENPESFRFTCSDKKLSAACVIAEIGQTFIWGCD